MIKSDSQSAQANKKDSTNQECWHQEPGSPCVRFELDGGRMEVLPYIHFVSASFDPGEEDQITIKFGSHKVTIKDHDLSKLIIAFQKQVVEWVRNLPERYRKIRDREAGLVTMIDVQETSPEAVP